MGTVEGLRLIMHAQIVVEGVAGHPPVRRGSGRRTPPPPPGAGWSSPAPATPASRSGGGGGGNSVRSGHSLQLKLLHLTIS